MNYKRNDNVIWEELEGGALLVDAQSGARFRLTAAATALWKLCDGTHNLATLARYLSHSRTAILQTCQQFQNAGLLCGPAVQTLAFSAPGAFQPLAFSAPGAFQPLGLGAGPRRRPSPRGLSGPG